MRSDNEWTVISGEYDEFGVMTNVQQRIACASGEAAVAVRSMLLYEDPDIQVDILSPGCKRLVVKRMPYGAEEVLRKEMIHGEA